MLVRYDLLRRQKGQSIFSELACERRLLFVWERKCTHLEWQSFTWFSRQGVQKTVRLSAQVLEKRLKRFEVEFGMLDVVFL